MIPPAWAQGTYLPFARVSATAGLVFQTIAGGTTGATEPTWPTAAPWTVSDGSVTWTVASSFRQQQVAGLVTLLTTFRSANPTMLKSIRLTRPEAMADVPAAFVGARDEAVAQDGGLRTRRFATSIVLVDRVANNVETENRMDALIDAILDLLSANPHAASGQTIVSPTAVNEYALPEGQNVEYLANEIVLGETQTQEGRL